MFGKAGLSYGDRIMSLNQEDLSHDIGVDRTDIKIVAFEKTSDIVTLKAILIN
jgi:hypothetical protein